MRISIVCSDGSPLGVSSKTIWGDGQQIGVGGAELALLTMCEEWTKAGHQVILYNDPREHTSIFEQRYVTDFDPAEKNDVVIAFRSPNPKVAAARGLRVWWSCDQQTMGDYAKFSTLVQKIVCISEHHHKFFQQTYGIQNSVVIDIPIRVDDYENYNYDKKVPYRMIFTSVPDRGLMNLYRVWKPIKRVVPQASLVITSDYRLWGQSDPLNYQHRVGWVGQQDVRFIGAVGRDELVKEQMLAQVQLYQCSYEELFCLAIAEAQVAGVLPITSANGALSTTNMFHVHYLDASNPHNDKLFVEDIEKTFALSPEKMKETSDILRKQAIDRFSSANILKQWDEKVFK